MTDCPTPKACETCWRCLHDDRTLVDTDGCPPTCIHGACKPEAPSNVVQLRVPRVTGPPIDTGSTAAALYSVERHALHLLDLAMRLRRDHELTGEVAPGMLGAVGEQLDRCAVVVAGCEGDPG